jgi:hypothetical protein
MNELGKLYELKPESVHEPDIYLGANMEKVQLPNGKVEWSMGSKTYVKNAIRVVEDTESISKRLQTRVGCNTRAQRRAGIALSPIDRDPLMGD